MTFTYVPDFTTDRDRIRRLIGDVDSTNPLFSDEELGWFVTLEGSYLRAAAAACEALAAAGSGESDFTIGGKIAQRASQAPVMWAKRAREFRIRANRGSIVPYAGGISRSDMVLHRSNADTPVLPIHEHQDTEPGTEYDDTAEDTYPPYPAFP